MDERRRYSRLNFPAESNLVVDGDVYPTSLVDISVRGALVEKPPAWTGDPGQLATLRIQLENSEVTLEMQMEVAHSTQYHLGLRRKSIDVDSLTHLRRILELNLGDPELVERELSELG